MASARRVHTQGLKGALAHTVGGYSEQRPAHHQTTLRAHRAFSDKEVEFNAEVEMPEVFDESIVESE